MLSRRRRRCLLPPPLLLHHHRYHHHHHHHCHVVFFWPSDGTKDRRETHATRLESEPVLPLLLDAVVLIPEDAVAPVLIPEDAVAPVLIPEDAVAPVLIPEDAVAPALLLHAFGLLLHAFVGPPPPTPPSSVFATSLLLPATPARVPIVWQLPFPFSNGLVVLVVVANDVPSPPAAVCACERVRV
jgi:hypothetical protein